MYPYQPPPPPPQVPPQRSNGVRPLIVVLIAAGSMLFGCISGAAITSQPNGTPVSGSKQATVTAQVTVTATPSSPPTMDANAREMCTNTVQAAAYLKAGDQIRAEDLQSAAETRARISAVPAVQRLGADTSADAPAKMAAWCKDNLPEVTASPVAKPNPKKTTAKPKPKPKKTTKEPAPVEEPAPVRDVTPGAFCSPAGATGTHNGKTYTCKGPGQARWRR